MLVPFELDLGRGHPRGNRVVVDGHNLAHAVGGFTLTAEAGQVAHLELILAALPVTSTGEADVRLHPAIHDALVALGWTPPPDREER